MAGRQPRLTVTTRAERDLDEAWQRIAAQSGPEQADAFVRRIAATAELYAGRPTAGRPEPALGAGLRSFLVRPYLAYYLPRSGRIEIIRVLHTRCNREAAWRDDDSST